MAIPAQVAADLIVIESEGFAGLQVLFDVPAGANGLHHGGQRRLGWRPDEVIGQLVRIVETAAHQQPMAPVHAAGLYYGQARPVEETLAFGTQALREGLPLPRTERLLGNAGHIREQEACPCLHTDHLDGP